MRERKGVFSFSLIVPLTEAELLKLLKTFSYSSTLSFPQLHIGFDIGVKVKRPAQTTHEQISWVSFSWQVCGLLPLFPVYFSLLPQKSWIYEIHSIALFFTFI